MAHHCVDWSATPPRRKTPLLVLSRGDEHVYTVVPKELQTLQDIAKREFGLADADVHFLSPCVSLCHGRPARITEHAWEHLSPYIGCATVEVTDRPHQGPSSHIDNPDSQVAQYAQHSAGVKRKARSEGHDDSAREAVRDSQDITMSDGSDRHGATEGEHHDEPREEDVSVTPFRRLRVRRNRVTTEDESREPEREHEATYPPDALPIKQDRPEGGIGTQQSRTESQYGTPTDTQTQTSGGESAENHKVMIRVAHRASQQESKFTAKGATKVAKVLAGACKSFDLDPSRATLHLIVLVEDDGEEVENLFPCDNNDSIVRAGAERDTESRFLLKIEGDA